MLMHILSPYPADRSALTDCVKLVRSQLAGQKAVVIYGFDYPGLPMDPAIEAFELLARARVLLGARSESAFEELVHPVHQRGRVFGWESKVHLASEVRRPRREHADRLPLGTGPNVRCLVQALFGIVQLALARRAAALYRGVAR